jgi:hypothetical protein
LPSIWIVPKLKEKYNADRSVVEPEPQGAASFFRSQSHKKPHHFHPPPEPHQNDEVSATLIDRRTIKNRFDRLPVLLWRGYLLCMFLLVRQAAPHI